MVWLCHTTRGPARTYEQETMSAGRHVVVTGGSRGIGAAIAHRLASDGFRVTMLARSIETARALAADDSEHLHAVAADVTNDAEVDAAFKDAVARFGAIQVLVNSAGQAQSAPFSKMDLDLWQRMLDVNLTGTMRCTQAVLPAMLESGWGRVVNIASTAGLVGYRYVAAYCASKHGVIGLTRALALELARSGVTVNAVCPGYTDTEIMRAGIRNVVEKTGRSEADAKAAFVRSNPQGRLVQPDEVADAVAWLCGDQAGAVTGQAISVSGGEVM